MDRRNPLFLIVPAWALVLAVATAQEAPPPEPDVAAPPPLPPKKVIDAPDEAPVVIRTGDDGQIIEEYRQNGRVYMVKITPKKAPPYYLYDLDGDGTFEDLDPRSPIKPVYWRLAEWQ